MAEERVTVYLGCWFDAFLFQRMRQENYIGTFLKPEHVNRIKAGYTLLERIRDFICK